MLRPVVFFLLISPFLVGGSNTILERNLVTILLQLPASPSGKLEVYARTKLSDSYFILGFLII
jgi:hypothetical protein